MTELTPKQRRFIELYLVDFNATQAALGAGYAKASARTTAQETLLKPAVKDAIKAALDERAGEVMVTRNYVTRTIVETVERCRQAHPVLDKEGNPVMVGVEDEDGNPSMAAAYVFDAKNVLAGCGLLAKHLGMDLTRLADPDGRPLGSGFVDRLELARRSAFLLQNAIPGEATPA